MRNTRIYDMDGYTDVESGYDGMDAGSEATGGQQSAPPSPASPSPLGDGGSMPLPPSDPGPGPNGNPAPQGGNPPAPQGPPPAVVSSVPGVKGSETTGGVQGSFAQAGDAGFSKRFGLPAAWFKGGPTAGLAREASNKGRGVLSKGQAGQVSGGYGAETVANPGVGPSLGGEGGGKNDEEFQRMLRAVLQNRFQR